MDINDSDSATLQYPKNGISPAIFHYPPIQNSRALKSKQMESHIIQISVWRLRHRMAICIIWLLQTNLAQCEFPKVSQI